jgi:NADPH:quinone reductase
VRIAAANVNPTDLGARSGQVRARNPRIEPPFVPGWDLAGEVLEVGANVDRYAPGDRVVGMIPWGRIDGRVGTYAQAAAVDPAWLAPAPAGVDEPTAATLPLNALTARQALHLLAAPPGATVLITSGSCAVGAFATQLAVQAGYRVLAVATWDDEDWVAGLGAAEVLPRSTDLARIGPVDAVLDVVPIGPEAIIPVRDGGTAVFTRPPRFERHANGPAAGTTEVARSKPHANAPVMTGTVGGVRFDTILVQPDPAALAELSKDMAVGRLRSRVADVLPLAEAARAHRLVEAGGLRGKLLLAP